MCGGAISLAKNMIYPFFVQEVHLQGQICITLLNLSQSNTLDVFYHRTKFCENLFEEDVLLVTRKNQNE